MLEVQYNFFFEKKAKNRKLFSKKPKKTKNNNGCTWDLLGKSFMSYNPRWIHSGPLYQDSFFSSEKTSIDKTLRAEKQRNEAEKQPPPSGLFPVISV